MFMPPDNRRFVYLRADSYDDEGHPDLLTRCHFADCTHMRLAPTDDCWWGIVAIKGRGTIQGGGEWTLGGSPEAPSLTPSIKISGGKGDKAKVMFHGYLINGEFYPA